MFTTTEYFTVGHDVVTSIFEVNHFEAFFPHAKQVSFVLGGVGMRGLCFRLAVVSEAERLKGSQKTNYHFTVKDLANSALARNFVVWILLERVVVTVDEDERDLVSNMWGTSLMNAGRIYKNEKSLYLEATVLFPSKKKAKNHEAIEAFKDHLKANRQFNTTLMDRGWFSDLEGKAMFDVGYDSSESINHFPYDEVTNKPMRPDRLFEHMKPFFLDTAKAIEYLDERLKVEVVLGDYVDFAEKTQYSLYEPGVRPAEFPIHYDRIHLSNVPDYTHGYLTTFLHAIFFHFSKKQASLRSPS